MSGKVPDEVVVAKLSLEAARVALEALLVDGPIQIVVHSGPGGGSADKPVGIRTMRKSAPAAVPAMAARRRRRWYRAALSSFSSTAPK